MRVISGHRPFQSEKESYTIPFCFGDCQRWDEGVGVGAEWRAILSVWNVYTSLYTFCVLVGEGTARPSRGRQAVVLERFLLLLLCDCHLKGHIRFV